MSDQERIRRAVALSYDGHAAPRVVATGAGGLAERIIATAIAHGVPIDEDAQLVQLLAQVALGDEIPQPLYAAVAEVLAFARSVSKRLEDPAHRAKPV